jgi:glycosyltransferase involved in cell wall biosynthesis
MRVLVANIPLPANRFLVDLNAALAQRCDLTHSSDEFWEMNGDYDVVHLHFPEYLTFAIEAAYLQGLTDELIAEVERRLDFWSSRSAIVVTRHVLLPHDARFDPMWEKMYETVYRYADGVAHFANASVEEFRDRYRATRFNRGHAPHHAVIPHQNYASLPNTVGRDEARRRLGIDPSASVMLVFGAIRGGGERELVLDTFNGLRTPNKVLLVSRWREVLADVSWIRLKYWIRDLTRLYYRLHPRFKFNYGFVEEADTQLYLNAADVLFIPRLWVLNSGNVTLGMTFGRVVVGPDAWDVGELLRATGNPAFDPDRPGTAVEAVERGFELARRGEVGAGARRLAMDHWRPEQCADMYIDLYRSVTTRLVAGAPGIRT